MQSRKLQEKNIQKVVKDFTKKEKNQIKGDQNNVRIHTKIRR